MTTAPESSGQREAAGKDTYAAPVARRNHLANAFYIAAITLIAVLALIYGSGILTPLAVALLFWFFINALARMYERLWQGRFGRLRILSMTLSFLTLLAASLIVGDVVVTNVGQISARTADFEKSINILIDKVASFTGLPHEKVIDTALDNLNIERLLGAIVSGMTGLAGNIGIVFIYVMFLLVEQQFFDAKLRAILTDRAKRDRMQAVLDRIGTDIQSYLWTMFVVSMMTAILSYAVMWLVGLDSAAFWAFLIFLLNFIPTIGSILGTAIPALYALLQFADFSPFIALVIGIGLIQFVIGNIIQPRMAAQSLNMSQFVVILSLFIWGAAWGIIGMFLAVPLTAIIMLVFANFPQTRPFALALSENGRIDAAGSKDPEAPE